MIMKSCKHPIANGAQVHKSWQSQVPGHCLPFAPVNYTLAGMTILFDVLIFTLPIPLLSRLHMSKQRKYGLIGVFLLGLFTTACSIVRVTQISVLASGHGNPMLVLWGNIEINVGVGSPLCE